MVMIIIIYSTKPGEAYEKHNTHFALSFVIGLLIYFACDTANVNSVKSLDS